MVKSHTVTSEMFCISIIAFICKTATLFFLILVEFCFLVVYASCCNQSNTFLEVRHFQTADDTFAYLLWLKLKYSEVEKVVAIIDRRRRIFGFLFS